MNNIFEVLGFRSSHVRTTFPPLPVELVRHVMEVAATEDCSTALRLSLISRDIREWINPILYRTVILSTPQQLSSFHSAVLLARFTVTSHVKNLFLRGMSNSSIGRAVEILSACPHVERLVVDSLYRPPVDHDLSWPTPWEVVFMYGATSWLHKNHPSLHHVTHIHLDGLLFNSTLDACLSLPRLTHLGITHLHVAGNNDVYDSNFVRLVRRSLSLSTSLELVLIQLQPCSTPSEEDSLRPYSGRIWTELAKIEDVRLFARPALKPEEYSKALEAGTTIWDDTRTQFANWRSH